MDTLVGLLPIIAMFVVMWFFIIRPAQKRQKSTAEMQSNLKRGDHIITVGGLHGKVDAVDNQTIYVVVADGTRLQFERVAVGRVVTDSTI